jgi:hypothetical protein
MILAFGDHRHDLARRELRRGEALVAIEPSPGARVGTTLHQIGMAHFLPGASIRRSRSCSWRSRTIPASPPPIVFSPLATPIWGGSTKRAQWSPECGP